MDVRAFLEIDSSRINADILVGRIEEDPEIFDEVWGILNEDVHPLSMRAGRVIYLLACKHTDLVEPRIPEIIRMLRGIREGSVLRNMLGILSVIRPAEEFAGELFDFCYEVVESPKSSIAHRAYALTILYNISGMEPGFKPELTTLFEGLLDTESAGIRSRVYNLLKKLYRELG